MKTYSLPLLALLLAAALPLRADDDVVQQPDGMAPSASIHASVNLGGAAIDAQASTGGDNAAPAPAPDDGGDQAVPQMPTQEQQDYALGVADYYKAPPDRAWDFMDRGIAPEELPVVYHLAATAGVSPNYVVYLRLQGLAWQEVAVSLGLSPASFYWDDMFSVNLGGPFAGIYLGFHRYPRDRWDWDNVSLSDADFVNLVGLRFTSVYWHRPLREVWHDRALGRPYFYIGHAYNARFGAPFYAHHPRTWGGGYHQHYQAHVAAVRSGQWHRTEFKGSHFPKAPVQAHRQGNADGAQRHGNTEGRQAQGNAYGAQRHGNAALGRQAQGHAYGAGQAHGRKPQAQAGPAKHANNARPARPGHGEGHAEPRAEKTRTH
jgi:hypothetical protein